MQSAARRLRRPLRLLQAHAALGSRVLRPLAVPVRLPRAPLSTQTAGAQSFRKDVLVTDLVVGAGPEVASGELVKVGLEGRLEDGTVFEPAGEPLYYAFHRGLVVWGLDEGMKGMRVGGEREIRVPPHLGYGFKRVGPVPPNSVLVFRVKLLAMGADAEPPPLSVWQRIRDFFAN